MSYIKDEILHAIELRGEQIGLREEYELLAAEKHTATGGKKSSLTRKFKKVHTRLLELNAALLDAPPPPLKPDEAIVEIAGIVQIIQDTYESDKAAFIEHCADNPEHAVKYYLEDMMIAKAKVGFLRHIHKTLQSDPANLDALKKVVEDTREWIMNEHVLNIDSLSTSRESNLLDAYRHEAAIQLMQKRMAFTNVFDQMDSIFTGVEVWHILNGLEWAL